MIALLDFPDADIRMYADTEVERTKRLGACKKEPETVAFIRSIPAGSVFFDIGANVGSYSLIAAARGLKVVAFEASTPNFDHLVRNFHLNKPLGAECIPDPLWSREEMIEFCYSSREPGAALHQVNGMTPDREMKKAYPLDAWIATDGRWTVACEGPIITRELGSLPQPDYIKLDTDGCELEVLLGAQEALRGVQSLLVETDRTVTSHRSIRPLLEDWGFDLKSVHPHGKSPVQNLIFDKRRTLD